MNIKLKLNKNKRREEFYDQDMSNEWTERESKGYRQDEIKQIKSIPCFYPTALLSASSRTLLAAKIIRKYGVEISCEIN